MMRSGAISVRFVHALRWNRYRRIAPETGLLLTHTQCTPFRQNWSPMGRVREGSRLFGNLSQRGSVAADSGKKSIHIARRKWQTTNTKFKNGLFDRGHSPGIHQTR